jgi:hypothetical protein
MSGMAELMLRRHWDTTSCQTGHLQRLIDLTLFKSQQKKSNTHTTKMMRERKKSSNLGFNLLGRSVTIAPFKLFSITTQSTGATMEQYQIKPENARQFQIKVIVEVATLFAQL